jgi:class 3 adenylate cyclase
LLGSSVLVVTDGSAAATAGADIDRERLTEHLCALGATREQVDDAIDQGTMPTLVRNLALWGRVPDMTMVDIARELGVDVHKVQRVARAAGLMYELDEPVFVADDVSMFTSFVAGSRLFEPQMLLRYSRMLGDAAARVADGSVSMFLRSVDRGADDMAAPGSMDFEDRALGAVQVFRQMIPTTIERMLLHHFVIAAERFAAIGDSQHTVEAAVGFVDLTDSTGLIVDHGARVVEPALAAFEMSASDAAGLHGGRLVKLIGDAAMFIVPDAQSAVATASEIVGAVGGDTRLRGARGGVAYGELLHRDGDYFGDPVNLAARLASAAPTGEVLVDRAVATQIGERAVPDGTRQLAGFVDPVEVFVAR